MTLEIDQRNILIDVSFYDDLERQKLLNYPIAQKILELVQSPVIVPTAEFLTYYLFHKKRLEIPEYSNYINISTWTRNALASLHGCVVFNGNSISNHPGISGQITEIAEHIGEAVGLAVANRIHNLTEADWVPIPTQKGRNALPSFDFQLASNGTYYIQVENKGSSTRDNRVKSDNVEQQKYRILKKKSRLSSLPEDKIDSNPAHLRYGTIAVLDDRPDGHVRCLLTDPPPIIISMSPEKFRLLQRMKFIRDWIGLISPRSQLAAALFTRFADLEASSNPFELNDIPLRRGNGNQFEYFPGPDGVHSSFLTSKSRISDGPAGGIVLQIDDDALFLFGIRDDLFGMASNQNFNTIMSYQYQCATLKKNVQCVFSKRRYSYLRLPEKIRQETRESAGYKYFTCPGIIHYSPAGLVFGIIKLAT